MWMREEKDKSLNKWRRSVSCQIAFNSSRNFHQCHIRTYWIINYEAKERNKTIQRDTHQSIKILNLTSSRRMTRINLSLCFYPNLYWIFNSFQGFGSDVCKKLRHSLKFMFATNLLISAIHKLNWVHLFAIYSSEEWFLRLKNKFFKRARLILCEITLRIKKSKKFITF